MSSKASRLKNDIILIAVLLAAAAAIWLLTGKNGGDGEWVVVTYDGEETERYLLSEDREVLLEYGDSYNLLVINGSEAYIREAGCPEQICVRHAPISEPGESIICLANRVAVLIEGRGGSDASAG